jgi:hypothetical protein
MLSLLPFQGRDIEDKPKQGEVEYRRELLEDELPSGVFQRLAPGTPVSTKSLQSS